MSLPLIVCILSSVPVIEMVRHMNHANRVTMIHLQTKEEKLGCVRVADVNALPSKTIHGQRLMSLTPRLLPVRLYSHSVTPQSKKYVLPVRNR